MLRDAAASSNRVVSILNDSYNKINTSGFKSLIVCKLPRWNQTHQLSQQTQYIDPMLNQCWASAVDDVPTLIQHWVNVLCLSYELPLFLTDNYFICCRFHEIEWPVTLKLTTIRPLGYERVYLPLYKVADTPFHIQGDEYIKFETLWCLKHWCVP